jgi:hypothetical protein
MYGMREIGAGEQRLGEDSVSRSWLIVRSCWCLREAPIVSGDFLLRLPRSTIWQRISK